MLVNSVVIVLREVLEAALMISIFLAVSRFLELNPRWLLLSLVLGLFGAVGYGFVFDPVSELFDGVGQEVVNAALQFALFVLLAVIVFLIARRRRVASGADAALPVLMAAAVIVGISREGAEVFIFVSGFIHTNGFFRGVGIGSLAGACIGLSAGALFYYVLLALPRQRALLVSLLLLSLAAAGMCSQATRLLTQADWISSAGPLWDTSALLPESSVPGQLLYALIGYESSPSAPEVSMHLGSLAIMAVSALLGWVYYRSSSAGPQ